MAFRKLWALLVLMLASAPAAAQSSNGRTAATCELQIGTDRFRHYCHIHSLAISPDGARAASAGDGFSWPFSDNEIVVWDIASGRRIAQLSGNSRPPLAIAFSPDGKVLASAHASVDGFDYFVRLWDVASGKLVKSIPGPNFLPELAFGGFRSVAFAPDGLTLVASAVDNTVRAYSMPEAKEIRRISGRGDAVIAQAISKDGSRLVVRHGLALFIVDVKTGREIPLQTFEKLVYGAAFARLGKTLIAGVEDETVRWLDLDKGKELRRIRGAALVCSSANGKFLVLREGADVVLWDLERDKEQARFAKHVLVPLRPGDRVSGAVCDNGEKIIWAHFSSIKVLDTISKKVLETTGGHVGHVLFARFTKDGRQIISVGDMSIRTWDARTGRQLDEHQAHQGLISDAALTRDGKLLATGSQEGTVCFWSPFRKEEVFRINVIRGSRPLIAFSKDGKTVAVKERYDPGRATRIWDLPSQRDLSEAGTENVQVPAFILHERTLMNLGSSGNSYELTQKKLHVIRHLNEMVPDNSMALSPDRRLAATGYWGDGEHRRSVPFRNAMLWEMASGKMLARFHGHKAAIVALIFSSDGRLLATGAWDGTVRLWDIASGAEVACLQGHRGGVLSLAFSPDETRLVSAGSDTTIRVWDVSSFVNQKLPRNLRLADSDLDNLWTKLGDERGEVVYKALWQFVNSPDQAVPFLGKRLLLPEPDQQRFEHLLKDLDNDSPRVRERASRDIVSMGPAAEAFIRKALQGKQSVEVERRLEIALKKIESSKNEISGDNLRLLRAVQILEYIGNPQACGILEKLSKLMPNQDLGKDAKESMDRLAKKKSL